MAAHDGLTPKQVSKRDLRDWRVLLQTLQSSFRTDSMARGIQFAARVAERADERNHHPDLTVSYPRVHVLLTSHDIGGLSERDVALAQEISAIASEMGIQAEPGAVSHLEVAIDALDIPAMKPFWEAVLGYRSSGEDELTDPGGRGPAFWFQQMDQPREQRNRIHLDVTVPHDQAQARIEAALAAGGRMVSDERAPAFWVLADPEGNEACICTWQNRE